MKKEMWQDAHKLFLKSTDDLRVCRTINKELVAALEKIDSNSAESPEWIRRVSRQALTRAKELNK